MSDSLQILNAIRGSLGSDYSGRIPEATRDNIASVGNTVLSHTPHLNMFLTELINRIGRVILDRMDSLDDIYAVFSDEKLDFGDTIQKIFIDIPDAQPFEGSATITPQSMLAVAKGVIHVEYTSVDRRIFYKATISIPELKEAFLTVQKLDAFITAVIESMSLALQLDKYVMLTNTLYEHACYVKQVADGQVGANVNVLEVPDTVAKFNNTSKEIEWDTVGAKVFLKLLRILSRGLKFPHKLGYGSINTTTEAVVGYKNIKAVRTPIRSQVVALEVSTLANIDVDALAVLFNMSKAEVETRIIEIEDGALGYTKGLDGVVDTTKGYIGGFITDASAVVRGTSFEDKDSFKNPEHEYVNFWQHYWGYMAVSKFKDFVPIIFTTYTPSV